MTETKSGAEAKSSSKKESLLPKILSPGVTFLGLLYLTAIPLGWIGENRFGINEAAIFIAILFFNSALIGRQSS